MMRWHKVKAQGGTNMTQGSWGEFGYKGLCRGGTLPLYFLVTKIKYISQFAPSNKRPHEIQYVLLDPKGNSKCK